MQWNAPSAAIELLQKLERQSINPNIVMYTIVMYTTIIDRLCKEGLVTEVGSLFSKMTSLGILADFVSYNSLIHGFCCMCQLKQANIY